MIDEYLLLLPENHSMLSTLERQSQTALHGRAKRAKHRRTNIEYKIPLMTYKIPERIRKRIKVKRVEAELRCSRLHSVRIITS
jgi:hypothetical protein